MSRRTSVKHNSEAAHEIEASAASGKRPSEAAARPIFVTANFVTRLLFVTAPNASRAASNMVILRAKRPQDQRELSGMGCEKFVSAHIRKTQGVGQNDLGLGQVDLIRTAEKLDR